MRRHWPHNTNGCLHIGILLHKERNSGCSPNSFSRIVWPVPSWILLPYWFSSCSPMSTWNNEYSNFEDIGIILPTLHSWIILCNCRFIYSLRFMCNRLLLSRRPNVTNTCIVLLCKRLKVYCWINYFCIMPCWYLSKLDKARILLYMPSWILLHTRYNRFYAKCMSYWLLLPCKHNICYLVCMPRR